MTSLTKATAYRIEAMESAHLIWYKHHIPWADNLISSLDEPPLWIIDLSTAKYLGDVQKLLRAFVFGEPFEKMDEGQHHNDYLASLILRYRRRELSWASFLDTAGRFSDCSDSGKHPCEYFFELLNNFEDADFAAGLETQQHLIIGAEYSAAVDAITPLYLEFRQYYPKQNTSGLKPTESKLVMPK